MTGETLQADWVDLFIQHKQEAALDASGALAPSLARVPGDHGRKRHAEMPAGQVVLEGRADSDHAWQPVDAEATSIDSF